MACVVGVDCVKLAPIANWISFYPTMMRGPMHAHTALYTLHVCLCCAPCCLRTRLQYKTFFVAPACMHTTNGLLWMSQLWLTMRIRGVHSCYSCIHRYTYAWECACHVRSRTCIIVFAFVPPIIVCMCALPHHTIVIALTRLRVHVCLVGITCNRPYLVLACLMCVEN